MQKSRKPNSTRKPPVPADSHADIEDWIRRVMPDLHPIVERLDESIRETIPGLQYAVKWKKAYYGLPELGWIIEMVAYDVSVNVVFLGGAGFDTSAAARDHGPKPLRQADDPRAGPGAGDARVDRAGGASAGLEMSPDSPTVTIYSNGAVFTGNRRRPWVAGMRGATARRSSVSVPRRRFVTTIPAPSSTTSTVGRSCPG